MFHNEEKNKTTSNDHLSNLIEDKTKSNSKSVSEENQGSSISEDTPLENYIYEFETLSTNYEGLEDDSLVFNKYPANQMTGTEDKYSLASPGELYLIFKQDGGVLNQQKKVKEEIVDFQETPIEGHLNDSGFELTVIDQTYSEQIPFNLNTQYTPKINDTGSLRDETSSFKSIILPQCNSNTSTEEVEKRLSNMLPIESLQPISLTSIETNIHQNTEKQYATTLEASSLISHAKCKVSESAVTSYINQRAQVEKTTQLSLFSSDPLNSKENTASIEKELSHAKHIKKPENDIDDITNEAVAQLLLVTQNKSEEGKTDAKETKITDSLYAETKYNLRNAKSQSDSGKIRNIFLNAPTAQCQSSSSTALDTNKEEQVSCEKGAVQKSKSNTPYSKDKTQTSVKKNNITQKSPKHTVDHSELQNQRTSSSATPPNKNEPVGGQKTITKPLRKSPRRTSIDDIVQQCVKRTWSTPKRVPTTLKKSLIVSGDKSSPKCAETDLSKNADPYAFHSDSEESVTLKENKHTKTKSSGKLQLSTAKVPEEVQTPNYSADIDSKLTKNTLKCTEESLVHSSDKNVHNEQPGFCAPKSEPVQQSSYPIHSESKKSKEDELVKTRSSSKDNSFTKESSSRNLDGVHSRNQDELLHKTNVDTAFKPQSPVTKVSEKVQTPTSTGVDSKLSKNSPKCTKDKLVQSARNGPASLQKRKIPNSNVHNAQHGFPTPKYKPVQQGSQHYRPPLIGNYSMDAILNNYEKPTASYYHVDNYAYKHPAPQNQHNPSRSCSQQSPIYGQHSHIHTPSR